MAKKKPVDVEKLLDECLQIMQGEITKIKNNKLDQLLESRVLTSVNENVRTLIQIQKETRMSSMQEDIGSMSDEELKALALQAAKYATKDDK